MEESKNSGGDLSIEFVKFVPSTEASLLFPNIDHLSITVKFTHMDASYQKELESHESLVRRE